MTAMAVKYRLSRDANAGIQRGTGTWGSRGKRRRMVQGARMIVLTLRPAYTDLDRLFDPVAAFWADIPPFNGAGAYRSHRKRDTLYTKLTRASCLNFGQC